MASGVIKGGPMPIDQGGTGATTARSALENLGLGSFGCITGSDMNAIYDECIPYTFSAFVCFGDGNTPDANNAWVGIQYRTSAGSYGMQFAFSFGSDTLYIRRRVGSNTFTAWKSIT